MNKQNTMKKIYTNARIGWKSTVMGLLIFFSSMAYLFVPMVLEAVHPDFNYDVNMWYLAAGIITSLALIMIPDSIVAGLKKLIRKYTAVALLLLVPWVSSCVTYNKCQSKFRHLSEDSVYLHVVDTVMEQVEVIIPGDSLLTRIQLDSLLSAKVNDTIIIESDNGRAQVKFWKDKYNNFLNFRLDIPVDTIRDTLTVYLDKKIPCPPVVYYKDRTPWIIRKLEPFYIPIGIISLFLISIFLIRRAK